jgi:hypothetical protein
MQNKSKQQNTNINIDKLSEKVSTSLQVSTGNKLDESVEEYTDKEIEYIDKSKLMTGDLMEDEDIYDVIIKYNYDDKRISEELKEALKLMKNKGEEYGWTKIEHGKSNF